MFFREISFVFRLQIQTPCHRKLEFLSTVLENIDGFRVLHALELVVDDGSHSFDDRFVDALFKECHIVFTFFQDAA